MIHGAGAPVWVTVGRTEHHAHIVSAINGVEYEVRWSSSGLTGRAGASDVRPDAGGRGRTRRSPAEAEAASRRAESAPARNRRRREPAKSSAKKRDAKAKPSASNNRGEEKYDNGGDGGDDSSPRYAVGQEIEKFFPSYGRFYKGRITGTWGEYYSVKYEDDDEEDIHRDEIGEFVEMARKRKKSSATKKVKKVAAKESADDDDGGEFGGDSDEEMDIEQKSRPARKRKKDDGSGEDDGKPKASKNGRARKRNKKSKAAKRSGNDDDIEDDEDEDEEEIMQQARPAPPSSTSRYGRARRSVQYEGMRSEWSSDATSDDDDPDDDFGSGTKGKARGKSKSKAKKAGGRKRGPPTSSEESSEESEASSVSSEESEDLSEDDFVKEEEEEEAVPKKKAARGRKAGAKTASGTSEGGDKTDNKKGGGKVGMAESFKPTNHPPFHTKSLKQIHEENEFLDPCGVEGTDNIIDRLVGDQVDKIGALLTRALKNPKCLGSKENPLKLGTACSGTDAPALGLTIDREQMMLRKMKDEGANEPLLHVEHNFSCEVDPFKQAYLARNFDSILYPDIGKLCDDPPRDVYGRPTELPDFNLFVAGTSCKNFSGLRTKFKLDIEAKGCSGETFLAAVELLLKGTPEFAIFENVIGAPWEKMKEYITGRIVLNNCGSAKQIGEVKAAEKKMDLSFVLEDGKIIVDRVPGVFGVRCGSVVDGFMKGGCTKLHSVSFPTTSRCKNTGKCSLTELMAHNKIVKKSDTLVFKRGVTYCAHYMKVDTKEFGLPQTRQRTYMFVWQPEDGNIRDDLGEYWEAIVTHLKSPVRHSLESFILQPEHDIIRVFREALAGPAGRASKRAFFLEPDFWTSSSANLKYSTITRDRSGINAMARSLTKWGPFGQKQVPPHYWMEYLNICSQRQLDLLEILHASALRDTESHDSSFSSFYWNISQNAGKEKHRSAVSGIAGCVTPGGNMFLPHLGRPLLGSEKLMLQGIPLFRLLLGNETEVQLGDLAGNAMSLTVVNATILAAITCKQLRLECNEGFSVSPKSILEKTAANPTESLQDRIAKDVSVSTVGDIPIQSELGGVFRELLPYADEAVKSSILCTCESSGRNSSSLDFVRCRQCGVSCCRDCLHSTAGYQLDSHDVESFTLPLREQGAFQSKLHSILPTSIVFGEEVNLLSPDHRANNLDKYIFGLHRIRRDKRAWRIVYYARADGGTGEAIAEFTITLGEIEARGLADCTLGVDGSLTSFLPAKLPPLKYGNQSPCARVVLLSNGSREFRWMQKMKSEGSDLIVTGIGETQSFRAESGINDEAQRSIYASATSKYYEKHATAAKKRGEERRFCYATNWKQWPRSITIEGGSADATAVHGRYDRANCRQTTNQSCLYVREARGSEPTLYLLMHPQVSRNGPDFGVISSSLCHKDASSILAAFPASWQPCDALVKELQLVKNVQFSSWVPLELKCRVPKSSIEVSSPNGSPDTLLEVSGLSELDIAMLSSSDAGESTTFDRLVLNVARGQHAQQTVRIFNSIFTTPIHKFEAKGQLKYDLSPNASWTKYVQLPSDVAIGCCEAIIPRKPVEHWSFDDQRETWVRLAKPGASRQYFKSLQEAPNTFSMILHAGSEKKIVIKFDPRVVTHKAAHNLIEGRGDKANLSKEVSVTYRLSDSARQTDPVLDPFSVSNCETLRPTNIELDRPHELYDRQKKVVTKMAAIEDGNTLFEELEMFDEQMPGSTGWSCIAKATRNCNIRGGVIADAIGAGKTVISIALILRGITKARAARKEPAQSSATLVVVPPGLLDQWKSEVDKFASSLAVICVYGLPSLKKLSIKDLLNADVIVCPIDILESPGYLQHVLSESGTFETAPKLPMYSGQQEKTGASGVWIPGTSQDPYAGGKGKQESRNESAYYTYLYTTAVEELRKKSFGQSDKGVPLEFFCWERIIVDEIHESLCTSKGEMNAAKEAAKERDSIGFFREKNRRAGRELLGITEKNVAKRPLKFRTAMFGLTGTPLLDNCDRVIELANLMGGTYVIGLSSHWRKLERESMRDIFLQHFLDPKQSREVRRHIYSYCQKYLDTACCRNKTGDEMESIVLISHRTIVEMNDEECELYLGSMSGIPARDRSLAIKPADFDVTAGHDISRFLRQNAKLACRGKALVKICKNILSQDGNERTKIIVFADGRIGAGVAARDFLCAEDDLGCTWLDVDDSVEEKNKKISWYQSADVTAEDRARPRVLVLNFEHAAGLNLQTESNNLVLFSPLYVGEGGTSGDAVADASTELQAIGRVYRPGQTKQEVYVYRIEVRGPGGEECLDGQLIRRNTDEDTVAMATNAAD